MRRLLLPAALLLLAVPAFGADTGDAREMKDKNFRWTLPSKQWAFTEPTADQKSNGYVLGATLSEDGGVVAHVRVVPAGGLKPSEAAEEMRTGANSDVQKQTQSTVAVGKLSGLEGSVAMVSGTAAGGGTLWYRGYAIVVSGTLHQLLINAYNGAETKRGVEIDALRRGYRLLKGSGPEEAAAAPEVHFGDETPKGDGGKPDNWPAAGPKREGSKITFPSHNMSWTLPEGTPFQIVGVTEHETQDKGELLVLNAEVPRKTPGDGEPRESTCRIAFLAVPLKEGQTAGAIVSAPNVQADIAKQVFNDQQDASKTKTQPELDVGNVKGGRLTMASAQDKAYHWFILQIVTLKAEQYEWHISMRGAKDVTQELGPALGALFKGVQFLDTKEAVRGPVAIENMSTFNGPRGESTDKESEITVPGLTATKPKGVSSVIGSQRGNADPALRLAWETRSTDGMAYLFFDVRTYDAQALQRDKTEPQDLVKARETQWKTGGGDDAVTVSKGKDAWFDTNFAGAKGVGYRFTGSQSGHPFVEMGWVLKAKNNVVFLRAQFGGANAEKTLDGVFKAIKKGIRLP